MNKQTVAKALQEHAKAEWEKAPTAPTGSGRALISGTSTELTTGDPSFLIIEVDQNSKPTGAVYRIDITRV